MLNDGTLDPAHTIIAIWPSPMSYSGPAELLWHVSSLANCGVTHFIAGSDPLESVNPEDHKRD